MMSGVVFPILVALAFLHNCEGNEELPSRYCIDPQCSGPISRVQGLLNFISDSEDKLSFQAGDEFNIYGKLFGKKGDLWIAEINGKKGYVPRSSVKELRMLHKGSLTVVPSNIPEDPAQEKKKSVKPEDSVSEVPDKGSSSTVSYEVVDGTTIPVYPSMTATPTGSTTEPQKEMTTIPIEPTSSLYSKYAESHTQSYVQTESSPISTTTMIEKPEEAESSTSTDDDTSESNVFNTAVKLVSGIVSGKNEDEKNHEIHSEAPQTEKMHDNPIQGEPKVSSESSDSKGDETERSDLANENEEAIVVTSQGDSEEDEDNDEEGDDDDDDDSEGEEEEEEEGDEEPGEAKDEISGQKESNADLDVDGQKSRVENVEKTVQVVASSYSVESRGNVEAGDVEVKHSNADGSFENKSESSKDAETASEVHSSTSKTTITTDAEPITEKDIGDKTIEDIRVSTGYSPNLPLNYLPNPETRNSSITDSGGGDPTKDESAPTVENSEPNSAADTNSDGIEMSKNLIGDIESGQIVTGQTSEGIASQDELEKDVSKSEQVDVPHGEEQIPKDEVVTTESPLTSQAENPYQQSSAAADSKIVINEDVTVYEMSQSEATTVSPHYEGSNPEDNVEISTPSSYEQTISEESSKQENVASDKIDSDPVKEHPDSQIDNDQLEQKEEMKNADEAVDSSGIESNLSISEESSGIFSMIFLTFSTGYDFVIDAVFGRNDEIEVITEGVGTINLVGNSDTSDNILNQKEDQQGPQDFKGHTHGINSNDHCEANPADSDCRKSTINWPSEAERSPEYQESKSWIDNAREEYQNPFDINNPSYYGALLFSTAVGGMLVCFFLGKYYIEGKKSDTLLVAKLNALEKKLMVSSTECLILKDKLRNADDSSEIIESLRSEVDKLQNETLVQDLKVAEEKIVELSSQLKKVEADLMQKEEEHHEKYDELRKLYDNQKKQYEEDLRNKTVEAVMVLTKCNSLEATLNETKDLLAVKENEISVLQECLEKIKASNGDEQGKVSIQFQDMLDFGKLKAELTSISKERDHLKEELQGEEEARKLLEDHVKVIKEEVEKLRKSHEAAERDKAEAQTRLEVLSSYFKEKESQLQKELGAQIQKYSDASSIVQHMKSLEEEVENYSKELNHSSPQIVDLMSDEPTLELIDVTAENEGSQNETLTKEILDQERGYKSQMASIEKRSRENWLAARQAERKLEESKQEAGQLRNRLTMLSKSAPQSVSQNGDDSKQNIRRKKFSKIRRFWSTLECAPSENHTQTK